ncbi:MAG TPA: penicillin-binding protein 2 [Burkholderiales bacterium]|nr:penicillin-binding protein 2 [Burkholderiales bacterium]
MIEIRNRPREQYEFRLRLAIAAGFVLLAFGALAARFYFLQMVEHARYHTLAEANRISIVPIVPTRGLILDRNGVVLAHNYSGYTLEIFPSKVASLDQLIRQLQEVIEISPKDRKRFKKMLEENRNYESVPIRTLLSDEEVARFAVNRYRFTGVEIRARLFRHYPSREIASHVTGYIGRISDKDLARLEDLGVMANYRGSEHIGKAGLEQSYEKELHGVTGLEQVEVDAGGRAVRSLSRTPPISGNNLILSLDARLQEVAAKIFGNYRGALVAIEPDTGEVLAMVSNPGFDPNLFVDGIDSQNWDALNNSPDKPLNNRALQGQYPPGSTFKPFMALAGLASGKRSPEYSIHDPGFFSLAGMSHRYRDWKAGGHGVVNLHKSLVISCDTYYYGLANDMGVDAIHDFIAQFGFGARTGIDIEGEQPGLLPSTAWKMKRYRQKWFAGDTISVGIGQGYNLATPIQLAHATAALANGGTVHPPRLVKAIQDSRSGELRPNLPKPANKIELKPDHLQRVKAALVDVTRPGGTAARAGANAPYMFAGKTGTAQVVGMKQGEKYDEKKVAERYRDHALFIAYAPADKPTIAVAVMVENGGHGGSTAAPIARQVFDYYLTGKLPEQLETGAEVEEEHD